MPPTPTGPHLSLVSVLPDLVSDQYQQQKEPSPYGPRTRLANIHIVQSKYGKVAGTIVRL